MGHANHALREWDGKTADKPGFFAMNRLAQLSRRSKSGNEIVPGHWAQAFRAVAHGGVVAAIGLVASKDSVFEHAPPLNRDWSR